MKNLEDRIQDLEGRIALLTEAWLITSSVTIRDDTAPQLFALGSLRRMADGLRAEGLIDPADILEAWILGLEGRQREFGKLLRDL